MVVFNLTFDPVEKKWKALQMGNIHNEIQCYQEAFHMKLRENLRALGLGIVPTEINFEIEGIPKDLNDIFSRRTKTIEETAVRLGITDPAQKAKLGAMTRDKKEKAVLITDLEPFWWGSLSAEHREALEGIAALLKRSRAQELSSQVVLEPVAAAELGKTSDALGLGRAIKSAYPPRRESMNRKTRPGPTVENNDAPTPHDYQAYALAVKHVFERQSAITEKGLMAEAFRNWRIGRTTFAGIQRVVKEAPLVRMEKDGRLYVTTAEVVAEEQRLYERCKDGKGRFEPFNKHWKIEDEKLNEQQRQAVENVLTSRDWVTGIAGKAGTGKTRLLSELRQGLEAGFNQVFAFAPSSKAARENLRNEGFKNAETVAKLLVSEELQKQARGAVWLVDEAGLLSTRQADQLFDLAQKLEARLVLIGDTGQHHSVERGQAFDLLQQFGEMSTVRVSKVMRQRDGYREFVELVSEGRIRGAFKVPSIQDSLKEMKFAERIEAIAADYVAAIERGKTALVIAPTHKECDGLAEGIRDRLKAKGVLGESVEWSVLRDQYWTEAQRSDGDHYKNKESLVVQLNGHFKGFALGEKLEVLEGGVKGLTKEERAEASKNRDGVVRVRSRITYFDRIKALPLGGAKHFNVYERGELEICAGERIRITANSRTADGHRVSNGNEYTVDFIDAQGRLVLNNGWHLDRNFEHLEYAYTSTPQGAQGLTVDSVFVSQSAASPSDLNQFYVAISRGRDEFKLYADDLELLQENVSRTRQRPMATEIMAGKDSAGISEEDKLTWQLGSYDEQMPAPEFLEKINLTGLEYGAGNAATGQDAAPSSELLGTQAESKCASIGAMVKAHEPPKQELEMEM
jgi:hypothetical protein